MSLLAQVAASDFRVSDRVLAWRPPRWFRLWMLWATRLGDGWVWLLVALLLASQGTENLRVMATACLASAIASAVFKVLKRRIKRPRPCERRPHPLFPTVRPPDVWSFPSGHTMNAFAIATVLALRFPTLAPPLAVVAASIGASRVILGLHYLSDVLAGAVLGSLVGLAVYSLCLG